MVVWQLCTMAQQTKLLLMSQTLDVEQVQRHALKSTKLHLGKLHVLPCFYFIQHAEKNGLGQAERAHTRTLLRNARLNTITVTKTCSNSK